MEKLTRLFDLLDKYAANYPKKPMLSSKVNNAWLSHTAPEVKELSYQLAASLLRMGLHARDFNHEVQDKVAIIANNRPEWNFADYATQQCGAISVPIYPTISLKDLIFIHHLE